MIFDVISVAVSMSLKNSELTIFKKGNLKSYLTCEELKKKPSCYVKDVRVLRPHTHKLDKLLGLGFDNLLSTCGHSREKIIADYPEVGVREPVTSGAETCVPDNSASWRVFIKRE